MGIIKFEFSCYPHGTGNNLSRLFLGFCILGKISIREEKKKSAFRPNNLSALKFFAAAFQLFKKTNLQSLLGSLSGWGGCHLLAPAHLSGQSYQLQIMPTVLRNTPPAASIAQLSSSQLLLITWATSYSCSRENILLVQEHRKVNSPGQLNFSCCRWVITAQVT